MVIFFGHARERLTSHSADRAKLLWMLMIPGLFRKFRFDKAKLDHRSTGPQAIPNGGNGRPANPVRGAERGAEDLA